MSAVEDMQRRLHVVPPPPPPELPSPRLTPPEQLAGILRYYRGIGALFDPAWERAYGLVRWPKSRRDASEWRKAVEDSREGWRAAYMGWPPEPREIAVGQLGRLLTEELRAAAAAADDMSLDTVVGF